MFARMVELADTTDLKSVDRYDHEGSSPSPGTRFDNKIKKIRLLQLKRRILNGNCK